MATHGGDIAPVHAGSRKSRTGKETRRRAARTLAPEPPSLRDIPLFAAVDDTTLSRLTLDAKLEHFEEGDVIFRQGDPVAAVVVVLSGFVKMLRMTPNGDETLIGIRADGETISEPPALANESHHVSAEAVGVTQVLKLPAARFARLMKESPALCAAVVLDSKNKIAALTREIESLKAQNADQRLARFLLALCPPNAEQCRFRLPYDKRLIAAQLGVKQETLSRAFAKLREFGVRTETREVRVESVSRLAYQCDNLGRHPRLAPHSENAA